MPALKSRSGGAHALAALLVSIATAALPNAARSQDAPAGSASAPASEGKAKVENSALDARLFYQLLIGEIQLREGEPGEAFQIVLDAARRQPDDQLFRHVTDIAVQARAGDQALQAVRAWRQALPDSLEALRYQLQLLIALNRVGESLEPLQTLLRQTPRAQHARQLWTSRHYCGRLKRPA